MTASLYPIDYAYFYDNLVLSMLMKINNCM
jgi:hypothetical protein